MRSAPRFNLDSLKYIPYNCPINTEWGDTMKTISRRTERLFMSRFVRYTRENDVATLDIRDDAFADLRRRPDFGAVLAYLEAKGFVNSQEYDEEVWYVTLTDPGMTYFETCRDVIRERRWTRGLAIAAIIISLLALILEFDDRGMLCGLFDGFRTTRSDCPSLTSAPPEQSAVQ